MHQGAPVIEIDLRPRAARILRVQDNPIRRDAGRELLHEVHAEQLRAAVLVLLRCAVLVGAEVLEVGAVLGGGHC